MRHALTPVSPRSSLPLSDGDAHRPKGLPTADALHERLDAVVDRLGELQEVLYASRKFAVLVILQGRDASGKDGVVRRVFSACNPLGCSVTSFKVPTDLELSHDYLWRVHAAVPPRGTIGVFNRSHYEDVLVVRVENLVPRETWQARYDQINAFERMLTENRVIVFKFFLHVSREEQKGRLIERLNDPTKNWKFRTGDLDARAKWADYTTAYRDALRKCSTSWAPWYVVPADHKPTRDLLIAETITARLESLNLTFPKAAPEVLALRSRIR